MPAWPGSLRDTDREPTHRTRRPEVHQWPRPPSFAFLRDVSCPTTLPHRPGAPSSPSLLRPAGFSELSRDEAPSGRLHPRGSGQRALSAPLQGGGRALCVADHLARDHLNRSRSGCSGGHRPKSPPEASGSAFLTPIRAQARLRVRSRSFVRASARPRRPLTTRAISNSNRAANSRACPTTG